MSKFYLISDSDFRVLCEKVWSNPSARDLVEDLRDTRFVFDSDLDVDEVVFSLREEYERHYGGPE